MRLHNSSFLLLLIFLLSACAEAELASHVVKQLPSPLGSSEDKKTAIGRFKVGSPYKIKGRKYYPRETYGYSKTGIASWYGPGFDGRMTANGEYFDQNELTAAHKTLQMPSIVRVTNLSNGRSIVVRINDRGPYAHGRLIDLSKRGAELLGFKSKGTAKVRVDVLPNESRIVADMAKRGLSTKGMEIEVNQNRAFARDFNAPTAIPHKPMAISGSNVRGNYIPDPVVTHNIMPADKPDIFIQAGSFTAMQNAGRLATSLRRFHTTTVQEQLIGGVMYYRVRVGPLDQTEHADALLGRLIDNGYTDARIVID